MATCGSLRQIFESPSSEDPFSSWSQIQSLKSVDAASITELFGELHFHDNNTNYNGNSQPPPLQAAKTSPPRNLSIDPPPVVFSEKLQLCTEGLGFESSVDVDGDLINNSLYRYNSDKTKSYSVFSRRCTNPKKNSKFPPPITSIRRNGTLISYKEDGRFVLREVKAPTMEYLHASREDGRLKLHLMHANEDDLEEEEDDDIDGGEGGHVAASGLLEGIGGV